MCLLVIWNFCFAAAYVTFTESWAEDFVYTFRSQKGCTDINLLSHWSPRALIMGLSCTCAICILSKSNSLWAGHFIWLSFLFTIQNISSANITHTYYGANTIQATYLHSWQKEDTVWMFHGLEEQVRSVWKKCTRYLASYMKCHFS